MAGDIRNLTGQPTGGVRQFETFVEVVGQPTRLRTWGIPTGPGWFDRPGKWNLIEPFTGWFVIQTLIHWVKRLLER